MGKYRAIRDNESESLRADIGHSSGSTLKKHWTMEEIETMPVRQGMLYSSHGNG